MITEIHDEINRYFTIDQQSFFPLPFLPLVFCNLCIGLALTPRPVPLA